MKDQVKEAIESAKAHLDQAIAELDTVPAIDRETLGYTAHKLKNYLSFVGAAPDVLEVYLAGFPDEQVQVWVESLQHAVQLMKHEVGRLMFSSPGAEPLLRLEKVDIGLLAFRACNFYRHKAVWKKIQIQSDFKSDFCFARTDRVTVAVVFDNLLSNALKFSDNGKRVWVDVFSDQDHVTFTVRDEGRGFGPEDMARLFQKGVRLSNAPTGGEPTLGFGLAIAKEIIEKLDGRIWCESRPGQGASFHVRLPAYKATPSAS